MDLLYLGKYKKRFEAVIQQIKGLAPGSSILELCFGDIYIAEYCKTAGYKWTGFDINEHFIKKARKRGFDAQFKDLAAMESLPKADACIIMGSLYHFYPKTTDILSKILDASRLVIISEPVSNLSSNKGIIGFLARRASNAGKGHEAFRFDKQSFLEILKKNSHMLGYRIAGIEDHRKDLIVKLIKNEKD